MGSRNRFKNKRSKTGGVNNKKTPKTTTKSKETFNPNAPNVTGNTYKNGKLQTNKTDKNKANWQAAGEALTAGAEVAGHMADKHRAANAGLSSSAAYGNFGEGQNYDTRPNAVTRKLNKKTDEWEY